MTIGRLWATLHIGPRTLLIIQSQGRYASGDSTNGYQLRKNASKAFPKFCSPQAEGNARVAARNTNLDSSTRAQKLGHLTGTRKCRSSLVSVPSPQAPWQKRRGPSSRSLCVVVFLSGDPGASLKDFPDRFIRASKCRALHGVLPEKQHHQRPSIERSAQQLDGNLSDQRLLEKCEPVHYSHVCGTILPARDNPISPEPEVQAAAYDLARTRCQDIF
ncbi:hypothetical protein OPV22_017033 [Ensete ventricosum]|uniref:Uncharacterized protein n=1 Tax=Ensete ventricosum TaxID=4639 RepID=A0AAV8R1A1_ENSVE|nr:hypothetical protein OPV22_017033 [Ensete ventricosum]